ncbi:hypothetical protein R3P38DRAFT_3496981 [Favolaschia claudopus]|uniref:Uncharacterized protein n=1 Tax=Favolaschia claudopus TaxID=2862362 RepID=A0AAW0C7G5_9AGAR
MARFQSQKCHTSDSQHKCDDVRETYEDTSSLQGEAEDIELNIDFLLRPASPWAARQPSSKSLRHGSVISGRPAFMVSVNYPDLFLANLLAQSSRHSGCPFPSDRSKTTTAKSTAHVMGSCQHPTHIDKYGVSGRSASASRISIENLVEPPEFGPQVLLKQDTEEKCSKAAVIHDAGAWSQKFNPYLVQIDLQEDCYRSDPPSSFLRFLVER